jgi:hypothetical protein
MGLEKNWEIIEITNAKSNHISSIAYIKELIIN